METNVTVVDFPESETETVEETVITVVDCEAVFTTGVGTVALEVTTVGTVVEVVTTVGTVVEVVTGTVMTDPVVETTPVKVEITGVVDRIKVETVVCSAGVVDTVKTELERIEETAVRGQVVTVTVSVHAGLGWPEQLVTVTVKTVMGSV